MKKLKTRDKYAAFTGSKVKDPMAMTMRHGEKKSIKPTKKRPRA